MEYLQRRRRRRKALKNAEELNFCSSASEAEERREIETAPPHLSRTCTFVQLQCWLFHRLPSSVDKVLTRLRNVKFISSTLTRKSEASLLRFEGRPESDSETHKKRWQQQRSAEIYIQISEKQQQQVDDDCKNYVVKDKLKIIVTLRASRMMNSLLLLLFFLLIFLVNLCMRSRASSSSPHTCDLRHTQEWETTRRVSSGGFLSASIFSR